MATLNLWGKEITQKWNSLSDAIMFAVALSSAPNHRAASLVGDPRRNGWASAARVWPIITTMNL